MVKRQVPQQARIYLKNPVAETTVRTIRALAVQVAVVVEVHPAILSTDSQQPV